jgi:hypothetical protein
LVRRRAEQVFEGIGHFRAGLGFEDEGELLTHGSYSVMKVSDSKAIIIGIRDFRSNVFCPVTALSTARDCLTCRHQF